MIINIYYGGRGLAEDPTRYVVNKLKHTLEEIRVQVNIYNLYEYSNNIPILVNTLKDVNGVIVAANVEWMGIGGLMQYFLDSCWLYADRDNFSKQYMMPVVISTSYGEEEVLSYLIKAWQTIGGKTYQGICAYVESQVDFETNKSYLTLIEESAEQFYKVINQKKELFPSSTSLIKDKLLKNYHDITTQENGQIFKDISDDHYVKKQKEDIAELTALFKGILDKKENNNVNDYVFIIKENFNPIFNFKASYAIQITDLNKTLIIKIDENNLKCYYDDQKEADVFVKISQEGMNSLVEGNTTFEEAFRSGKLTAKGNFNILPTFDQLFVFKR